MITKVIDSCIQKNLIDPNDKELYEYGLQQGLFSILNILTVLFIGVILGIWWQSLLFISLFMPLRMNAGGYHTRSHLSCYILSTGIIVISLLLILFNDLIGMVFFTVILISFILIVLLAPMEDENKPLDEMEKKIYKRRVLIILSVYIVISIVFWEIGYIQIAVCIFMAILLSAVLLLMGYIKNLKN